MLASYGSVVTAFPFSLVLKHCVGAVYQSGSFSGLFVEPRRIVPEQLLPRLWDEEVDIGAFLVHVLDAVFSLIVLHPGTGVLGAPPGAASAGEGRMRTGLTEDTAVEALLHAVAMALLCALGRPASGHAVGSEFWQPRPKIGIHVLFQDFSQGHDMRIGIADLKPVSHTAPPYLPSARIRAAPQSRYTPLQTLLAETEPQFEGAIGHPSLALQEVKRLG